MPPPPRSNGPKILTAIAAVIAVAALAVGSYVLVTHLSHHDDARPQASQVNVQAPPTSSSTPASTSNASAPSQATAGGG